MTHHVTKLVLPAVAAATLLSACGSSTSSSAPSGAGQSSSSGSAPMVKTAQNPKVGGMVLVDASGKTLYALSVERNGKFICTTSSCTSMWHPLTVKGSASPSGSVGSLGTVKRPNGAEQVTYKGKPLYTFFEDNGPGDANGEGFKDVGTWHAVTTSAAKQGSTPPASSSGGGYGGSSGGGYGGAGY